MPEKDDILFAIELLRCERPKGWRNKTRPLFDRLDKLIDPYGEHEWHGTELLGRSMHRADCPSYEDLSEESDP